MDTELIYVDNTSLEDVIEFQKASSEITDGYYFNEGRNETINHVIEYLYSLRLRLQKDKNPAQVVIKLLTNSMYGKTIIKPIETDTIITYSHHDFESMCH